MIISNLENVIREWNRDNSQPINTVYSLYKKMKASHLKVSRPILTRLWNDSPSRHINDEGNIYHQANSIKFDTLNRLVKFFNRPISDFLAFIGMPVTVTIQLLSEFRENNPHLYMRLNKMWPIRNYKKGDSVVRINHQSLKTKEPQAGFIFIAQPRYIISGIMDNYTFLNIRYTNVYDMIHNKLDKEQDESLNIRHDAEEDLKSLTKAEHVYLNTILFRNSTLTYPQLGSLFFTSFDFTMNTLDDQSVLPVKKSYFSHPEKLLCKEIKKTQACKFIFKDLNEKTPFCKLVNKMKIQNYRHIRKIIEGSNKKSR